MKSSGRNISLTPYDDIFSTEQTRAEAQRELERVQEIPLGELFPFRDHPFKVVDDDRMTETAESIKEYGVLVPAIARPLDGGGYELISGHRRKHACELAGLDTMPVIVRQMDDDAAIIMMVDSNLQRENILPSERAKAFQMKLEAVRRKAGRPSKENVSQIGTDLPRADEIVAQDAGISRNQVQRFVRLTNLVPELMDMVDEKKLAMNPAVEISFLKPQEQQQLATALEVTQSTPSLSQAQRIKQLSKDGGVTEQALVDIMSEDKTPGKDNISFTRSSLRKYFPKNYTTEQMEKVIIKLLEGWMRRRQQSQEH